MRLTLLLLMGLLPLVSSAQPIHQLEQQLQDGVAAYLSLEFEKGERVLTKVSRLTNPQQHPIVASKAYCFLAECQFELNNDTYELNFKRSDQVLSDAGVNTDTLGFYYRILLARALSADDPIPAYETLANWATNFPSPSPKITGAGLYGSGMANLYRGNYDLAFSQLKNSLEVQKDLKSDPFLSYDHSTMASLASTFQDYYLAVTHQKLAVDLSSTKRPTNYFRNLISLAGYQLDNRSLADSRQTINLAKRFGKANISPDSEFWMMYYNIQREYFNTVLNLDSLEYYHQQAEDFFERFPHHQQSEFYHDHQNFATGIAIRKGDFKVARSSIEHIFATFPTSGERAYTTLFHRSKVEVAEQKHEQSLQSIQLLLSINSSYGGKRLDPHYYFQPNELNAEPLVIEYLKDKASYYNQWDREDSTGNWLDRGLESIHLADSLINEIKQKNNQPGLRKQLDEISRELHKIEIESYYRKFQRSGDEHYIQLAINSSEQVKHLIISERLHENILNENYGLPDGLIKKERAYSKQLADDLLRVNRGGQIDSLEQLKDRISKVRTLQEELSKEIETNHPRFAALRYSPPALSLSEIRKEFIADDEVLFHFLERDSLIYLIGLSKDDQLFKRIRLSTPLAMAAPILIHQMESFDDSITVLLRTYYRELLEPVESFIQEKNLVVVPDAYLWHLPFSALITEDIEDDTPNSGHAYLIRERNVRHLFSLRVGLLQQSKALLKERSLKDVLSLSPFSSGPIDNFNQLAASSRTEQLLEHLIGQSSGSYLSGQLANRKAFIELAANARLLHIFSHAVINEVRPDSSFILLNPASDQLRDGYLTALDVYNTRLSAQLAVLAACKTAGGKYYQGQGIANLARAFAHAGCENLVVNLWESNGRAIEQLLANFYPAVLKEGKNGSTALAEAQRKYLAENAISAHPGYWAMPIYIGDRTNIQLTGNNWKYWMWLAAALLIIVSIATLKSKS